MKVISFFVSILRLSAPFDVIIGLVFVLSLQRSQNRAPALEPLKLAGRRESHLLRIFYALARNCNLCGDSYMNVFVFVLALLFLPCAVVRTLEAAKDIDNMFQAP